MQEKLDAKLEKALKDQEALRKFADFKGFHWLTYFDLLKFVTDEKAEFEKFVFGGDAK